MVPATPFTIFTKSSNNLFSDCIFLSSTLPDGCQLHERAMDCGTYRSREAQWAQIGKPERVRQWR
jgi:hypothetical protein